MTTLAELPKQTEKLCYHEQLKNPPPPAKMRSCGNGCCEECPVCHRGGRQSPCFRPVGPMHCPACDKTFKMRDDAQCPKCRGAMSPVEKA